MKIGDKVRIAEQSRDLFSKFANCTGIVTEVTRWEGELSPENHGIIEVEFEVKGEKIREHFTYYGWTNLLKHV
jgi:hypothetical protein